MGDEVSICGILKIGSWLLVLLMDRLKSTSLCVGIGVEDWGASCGDEFLSWFEVSGLW